MKTEDAVAHGIKTTAGVVTSAAVVMVGVFLIFATLPIVDMKEMGIGLAAAVLIDATIVRAVLLPATMKLLGDWNWYLPSWLGWLPAARARRRHHGSRPGGRRGACAGDVGMSGWFRRLFSRRLEPASGGYSPPQPRPSSVLLVR